MPKAGYCKECGKNVWLKEDGSCENEHAVSSISNVYEAGKLKSRKSLPVLIIVGVIALSCFGCMIFSTLISKTPEYKQKRTNVAKLKEKVKKKKKPDQTPPPASKTLAEHTSSSIKELIEDKLAEKITNIGIVNETGLVSVTARMESSWDENDAVFRTCSACEDVMPTIFGIPGVNLVDVQLDTEFTDIYGKSQWEKAVLIRVSKVEADKIDWEKISTLNRAGLIKVADTVYIHPAIYKEIDNEDIEEALAVYYQRKGL